ncbi:NUDIX hydrolase [Candidatus Parcubacteria bacterium]|nr:NUDIX hydrolase [Candidatus Parcubacteria bacterium]
MKIKKVIPDEAKKVFDGVIFDVYQWQQKMFDESYATFERLKRIDTAVVIPITNNGEVLILNQEQPQRGKFISLPAGQLERNEDPKVGAARELLEETGYKAKELELWEIQQPHSKIDWKVYIYIGRGCEKIAKQNLDVGEKIEVLKVLIKEFVQKMFFCEIREVGVLLKMLKEGIRDDEKGIEKMKKILFR